MNPRRSVLAGSLALLLAASLAGTPGAAGAEPPQPSGADVPEASAEVVTLVTGDRVTVTPSPDGGHSVAVDPAAREGHAATFDAFTDGGHTYVLPTDAARLVPEVFDRELFNVTRLAEYGYTDGIPVMTSYADGVTPPTFATPGTAARTTLPSIGAVAATIGPDGDWWDTIRAGAGWQRRTGEIDMTRVGPDEMTRVGPLAGVEKVWLDGRVEATLSESVPQIGAPAAWDAGYDGSGVAVAVLDTGVDDAHPDLSGKVAAERNFTSAESSRDMYGHGTHVAGIVTGSGAASGGTHVGVAPGVELMSGKVLNDSGFGQQSWIIAGMEWAAQQGADIINMSLGGGPTDGTDPISSALNQLSDQHDVMFVVAAGNSGPGAQSVEAPGTADAALTVGNVTKDEELAVRSSRGPRLGDSAVKPEITGPGTDIVAARSGDGTLPPPAVPIDEHHIQVSGTSMAAPHVAGAAALLQQQRPDLGAQELKAALAATAAHNEELDVYEQGAGRVDAERAAEARVLAAPATLDFGVFEYPHDDSAPVDAAVSYRNVSDDPVTLDLALEVADRQGQPVNEAAVTVSPSTVTLAPGESTEATVTVDVSEGEVGVYAGYLTAEDGATVAARTPLSFHQEQELHELTVEGIARDGRPAIWNSQFDVANMDGSTDFVEYNIPFEDGGSTTLRLPPGVYSVNGLIETYMGGELVGHETTFVAEPEVVLDGDTTVVLDATGAEEIEVATPEHPGADTHRFTLGYLRRGEDGAELSKMALRTEWNRFFAVPTEEPELGEFEMFSHWRLGQPVAALEVTAPVDLRPDPVPFNGSPRLDGELTQRLVNAGHGSVDEFDKVDAEGAVVLTRRGGPNFATKERNAAAAGAAVLLVANDRPGQLGNYGVGADATVPSWRLSQEDGDALAALLDDGEVTARAWGHESSDYLYEAVHPEVGEIPSDLRYVAEPAELATIDNSFHSDVARTEGSEYREMFRPWQASSVVFVNDLVAPLARTEYLVPGDTRYRQRASMPAGQVQQYLTQYESAGKHEQSWWRQIAGPGVRQGSAHEAARPVRRDGGDLVLELAEWTDADGNWGHRNTQVDTTAFRLYAGDTLLAEDDRPRGTFPLAGEPTTHRLELDVTREADWWQTSTATRTAWTMPELGPGAGEEVLPLLQVDYQADVDLRNTAPHPRERRGPATVQVQVDHQPGADGPPVAGARLWTSYDDGETWRHRPGRELGDGAFEFILDARGPGDGSGFASVRIEAWDEDGNRIEQDVIRAWRLAER